VRNANKKRGRRQWEARYEKMPCKVLDLVGQTGSTVAFLSENPESGEVSPQREGAGCVFRGYYSKPKKAQYFLALMRGGIAAGVRG